MASGSMITAVAGRVHQKMQGGPGGKTFDPTIIIAIITAIMQMLGGCKKSGREAKKIAEGVASQSGFGHRLFSRWYHQIVEANAPEDDVADYQAAILDEAGPTSDAEYGTMIAESATP